MTYYAWKRKVEIKLRVTTCSSRSRRREESFGFSVGAEELDNNLQFFLDFITALKNQIDFNIILRAREREHLAKVADESGTGRPFQVDLALFASKLFNWLGKNKVSM